MINRITWIRLMAFVLVVSILVLNNTVILYVFAVSVENTSSVSFSGKGLGTKDSPYEVSNVEQLDEVRNNLTAYYIQTADIDLSGVKNWKPIGNDYDNRFSGAYNGNGYKISNLKITSSSEAYVGLFGITSKAVIKNINLKNVMIDYVSEYNNNNSVVFVGAVAGVTNSWEDDDYNSITNCWVEGKINVEYTNCCYIYVGGIAGTSYADNCTSKVDIFCKSDVVDSGMYIGGITGHPGTVYGKITNCKNYGNIETDAGYFMYAGGITGADGAIKNCVNYGKINGRVNKLNRYSIPCVMAICSGGITGSSSGEVINSSNYGDVYCFCEKDIYPCAGGIAGNIGFYGDGKIQNCYSLGSIVESKIGDEYSYANRIAGVISGYNQIFFSNYSIKTQKINGQTIDESECGENTINGETISEYPFLYYEHPEFTIGIDNNSFGNSSNYFFLGNEDENYKIASYTYINRLLENQTPNYKKILLKKQYDEWCGSCFGIAVSTMYAYNHAFDITKYLNEERTDEEYYAAIDYPKMNSDVRDLIEVFQLSQFRSDVSYTDKTYKFGLKNLINKGSSLEDFLKNITYEAKLSNYMKPFFFGVVYKHGGHGLLVCGYEGESNGYYKLAVCDPNHEEYNYLMIKNDYSDFYMENKNGEIIYSGMIDSKNYTELKYFTYDDAYSGNGNNKYRESVSEDTCKLIVDADSSFYATFDDGTYLSYDGEVFSGTANIVNFDAITNGDDEAGCSWIIDFDGVNSVDFTELSDQIEVDCLFDDDDYVNVSGTNFSQLKFIDDKGVILDGKNATYDICIGDRINDDVLRGASGSTSSIIQYKYSGNNIITICNENKEDVKLYNITEYGYQDLESESTEDSIEILKRGDIDFNGSVDTRDLQKCVQHVSGRNNLEDKVLLVADVNSDEKVNIGDAMKILHYVSGRNSEL